MLVLAVCLCTVSIFVAWLTFKSILMVFYKDGDKIEIHSFSNLFLPVQWCIMSSEKMIREPSMIIVSHDVEEIKMRQDSIKIITIFNCVFGWRKSSCEKLSFGFQHSSHFSHEKAKTFLIMLRISTFTFSRIFLKE